MADLSGEFHHDRGRSQRGNAVTPDRPAPIPRLPGVLTHGGFA